MIINFIINLNLYKSKSKLSHNLILKIYFNITTVTPVPPSPYSPSL
nr:MAG TPA: hypothetical protein [Caudoviricetes sp.]